MQAILILPAMGRDWKLSSTINLSVVAYYKIKCMHFVSLCQGTIFSKAPSTRSILQDLCIISQVKCSEKFSSLFTSASWYSRKCLRKLCKNGCECGFCYYHPTSSPGFLVSSDCGIGHQYLPLSATLRTNTCGTFCNIQTF